ncbi:MAG: hypothetical protein XD40_1424 [Archaeoglobus fulgidus]|uniref:DUF5305 domain-containing protein n=1 Tax=Archaeoglobus fulgidus TaxID=2234 RepID=A0A101E0S7_ARCFL|nr:hypothetical protein [Archaeoglobus fulgidus]KUJ93366.1 MAG: hypothetical protein XD40_1424 [Archaeoglobus fulgidus]KUK06687.1 MAG: hypothetical protein XD48_1083 [Archaeoglobus fulgidus]
MESKYKKLTTVVLSVAAALLAVMALYAFSTPAESVRSVVNEVVEQKGEFKHHAMLSNESIYGSKASLDYYPAGITENIEGEYLYSISPERAGEYRMTVRTTYFVQDGRDKVQVWEDTLKDEQGEFAGSLSIPIAFNFTQMGERLAAVKDGTALPRLTRITEIAFTAKAENESFNHTITLKEGGGLYSFSDDSKSARRVYSTKEVTENSFGGLSVSSARIVYAAMAVFAAVPVAILNRDAFKRERRNPHVINGRREGAKIILESEEDLKKVFAMSDSPVVKTEIDGKAVYSIAAEGVVYEYREI